jgi:hypothetical protein
VIGAEIPTSGHTSGRAQDDHGLPRPGLSRRRSWVRVPTLSQPHSVRPRLSEMPRQRLDGLYEARSGVRFYFGPVSHALRHLKLGQRIGVRSPTASSETSRRKARAKARDRDDRGCGPQACLPRGFARGTCGSLSSSSCERASRTERGVHYTRDTGQLVQASVKQSERRSQDVAVRSPAAPAVRPARHGQPDQGREDDRADAALLGRIDVARTSERTSAAARERNPRAQPPPDPPHLPRSGGGSRNTS